MQSSAFLYSDMRYEAYETDFFLSVFSFVRFLWLFPIWHNAFLLYSLLRKLISSCCQDEMLFWKFWRLSPAYSLPKMCICGMCNNNHNNKIMLQCQNKNTLWHYIGPGGSLNSQDLVVINSLQNTFIYKYVILFIQLRKKSFYEKESCLASRKVKVPS